MKKIKCISIFTAAAIFAAQLGVMAAADDVTVRLNGGLLAFDVPPRIINERTMVPLRTIFEAMGADVDWDQATKTVTSVKDDVTIKMTIGEYYMYLNGRAVELDTPPLVIDDRTLVPVRAIAEGFGASVDWNNDMRAVIISYDESSRLVDPKFTLTVNGNEYNIGMSASELGSPDEIVPSTRGYMWYVYGTDTYKDFFAAGVAGEKVVALASSGKGFEYCGYKSGDVAKDAELGYLYEDSNDNMSIHGVYITDPDFRGDVKQSAAEYAGESKMNFHFVNGFHVFHGSDPLMWSDEAATAARLHSEDMANNNYFAHNSLDGARFSVRLKQQGISYSSCGENISAGRSTGFAAYADWVNSEGHRRNMLGEYRYLGVGGAWNSHSNYSSYFTQDFYE